MLTDDSAVQSTASTAESHAAELERLNEEIQRVATRATRLLDVTAALSEAQSVEDVTTVFLTKGLVPADKAEALIS